jgi:hypothetical protein
MNDVRFAASRLIANDVCILRRLSVDQAAQALSSAWNGGKNLEQNTPISAHVNLAKADSDGYVEVRLPLSWVRPNEDGDLYDGTVNRDRARRYARLDITTPVHLLFGERGARRGLMCANVSDGGHRVSAARMRGDTHLLALMPASDLTRLIRARETSAQAEPEDLRCGDRLASNHDLLR